TCVSCGDGGGGTVVVPGGPSGSFSGQGSPGPSSTAMNGGPFSSSGAGLFSGQGSPGIFTTPDADCAALCARIAALSCDVSQGSGTPRDNISDSEPCAQSCTAERARLTSDCERDLFNAAIACLLNSTLVCGNGLIQYPLGCPRPTSPECPGEPTMPDT